MTHNLHGDIPPEHIKLAEELVAMELYLDTKGQILTPELQAKGYTCIAADFYSMGDEETGQRLLDKAASVCSTYFDQTTGAINKHMDEDPEFNILMKHLMSTIIGSLSDTFYGDK
jgi:hypothetical protein